MSARHLRRHIPPSSLIWRFRTAQPPIGKLNSWATSVMVSVTLYNLGMTSADGKHESGASGVVKKRKRTLLERLSHLQAQSTEPADGVHVGRLRERVLAESAAVRFEVQRGECS